MKNNKTLMLTQLALLTAIEVILTFTPLGFIMIPPVSIRLPTRINRGMAR